MINIQIIVYFIEIFLYFKNYFTYASGKYERIICADLYPNYWSIKRHQQFLEELDQIDSNTKVTDTKIIEKSDLVRTIQKASDLLYVTHDYYQNVSTKENLLKQTSKIAAEQKHLKKFISVLPVELDNWAEDHPLDVATQSAETAHQIYDRQVILRTDLMYGFNGVLFPTLFGRLVNHQSIVFNPSQSHPQPLHCDDVAKMVQTLLEGNTEGVKYLAQGPERISWKKFFSGIEKMSFNKHHEGSWEKVISPLHQNMVSELFHDRNYMNVAQCINKYHQPPHIGYETVQELGVQQQDFDKYMETAKGDHDAYKINEGTFEQIAMNKLY